MSIAATTGLVDITQVAADKAWATAARTLTASTNLNDISLNDIFTYVIENSETFELATTTYAIRVMR